jgi:hypothetical protein
MKRNGVVLGAMACLAIGTAGCEELIDVIEWDGWFTESETLSISQASLEGDMGTVDGFTGGARVEGGFDTAELTTFNLTSENEAGEVMTIIRFDGGLDHPAWQPGQYLVFGSVAEPRGGPGDGPADPGEDNPGQGPVDRPDDEPDVTVQGCSNDDADEPGWDYDQPAEGVEVECDVVEDDPGAVLFTVHSHFAGGEVMTSRFVYASEDREMGALDEAVVENWFNGLIEGSP